MTQPVFPSPQHQSFGCLILVNPDSGEITHASANCADALGHDLGTLLGANLRAVLGQKLWHALRNAAGHPDFAEASVVMSDVGPLDETHDLRAFRSGALHGIEFAPRLPSGLGTTPVLDVARAAMAQFLPLQSEAELSTALSRFLHRVTGYDHAVLWQAPAPGLADARIVAEAKRLTRESAIGQTEPWSNLWQPGDPDLRVIADCGAARVPVLAAPLALSAPDLNRAMCNAIPDHRMTHLHAHGVAAAFQLRLSCRGDVWGMLECQSLRPRRPSAQAVALSLALLPYLDVKLQSLTPR
ncbi:hypothetical protein [Gymnodinialimonas ulvae]|uniref:hypothetical protein n=1 Tax=Gymnodinialimonas ulvae TaxID=3126504 RepID=UPI0030A2A0F1